MVLVLKIFDDYSQLCDIIITEYKGRLIYMSDREISFRSVIFLIIGVLLLLSLVVCIYVVNGEKDLVLVQGTVIDIKDDSEGTGKNDVTVAYEVDNTNYQYNFYYKDNIKIDDKVNVYYHEDNPTSVQTFKTTKLIFICPIAGLILCIVGVFDLFRKSKRVHDDLLDTKIISVDEITEQIKIITDNTEEIPYIKSDEEEEEASVKEIKGNYNIKIIEEDDEEEDEITEELPIIDLSIKGEEDNVEVKSIREVKEEVIPKKKKKEEQESLGETRALEIKLDKVLEDETNAMISLDELDNMKASKKEKPVKKNEEIEMVKLAVRKIMPKYYYLTGLTLVCELVGDEVVEINLRDVEDVTKTINSEGKLVKLTVDMDGIKCLLTNMNKVNLENVANLIHNKILSFDEDFEEKIEYKEY